MRSLHGAIQADMVAEVALTSSGMTTPFPCAILFAYNICDGLTGLGSIVPGDDLMRNSFRVRPDQPAENAVR